MLRHTSHGVAQQVTAGTPHQGTDDMTRQCTDELTRDLWREISREISRTICRRAKSSDHADVAAAPRFEQAGAERERPPIHDPPWAHLGLVEPRSSYDIPVARSASRPRTPATCHGNRHAVPAAGESWGHVRTSAYLNPNRMDGAARRRKCRLRALAAGNLHYRRSVKQNRKRLAQHPQFRRTSAEPATRAGEGGADLRG